MKSIKLTEEHKSRLLEMCKVLFPEYQKIWFHSIDREHLVGNLTKETDPYKLNLKIHWFEFCMTHLITKLYNISNLKNESSIKQLRGYVCQDVDHPVDYLYEEFKKLNYEKD